MSTLQASCIMVKKPSSQLTAVWVNSESSYQKGPPSRLFLQLYHPMFLLYLNMN
ncbi:hypothetical protein PAXRUDRAFT_829889 [Paxillus rubicundulus Ve08.2h10]|uniref:Uncharacterized protein n=1 Tax=Paxillus rubicundulus Ve08.2h10 TaxID=930991 RepID=A0A0D0D6R3_9AGAM|nr:hypothetical protein PAXRUDRAFT_829889 [Paxillus rubicundulus Ve08.2h10]